MADHSYTTSDTVLVDVHKLSPLVAQQHGVSSGTTAEASVTDASSHATDGSGQEHAVYDLDCVNIGVQFSGIPERQIEGLA